MTDEQLAAAIRESVARLNDILTEAARTGLSVTVRITSHQTYLPGVEQLVVEPRIFKQL